MIKQLKICGISDPKILNYILNHPNPPKFIGFITNYRKSKRFVEYEKLKELLSVNKRDINFISVLVNPSDGILEKIKNLNLLVQNKPKIFPYKLKKLQKLHLQYKK